MFEKRGKVSLLKKWSEIAMPDRGIRILAPVEKKFGPLAEIKWKQNKI